MASRQKTGKRRHLVEIQENRPITNEVNEKVPDWVTLPPQCFASITQLSGNEAVLGLQVNAEATHQINIRYRPDVKPEMRVKFGNRVFDINSVDNVEERNWELDMVATELTSKRV